MLFSPFAVWSQLDSLANRKAVNDCEATLATATNEFNAGRFFSLPSILQKCLDGGFSKEQKVRAYILLCQVYLINDNPAEAEASYLKLLRADPEYIATPEADPIDVVFLSKKFTSRPVFTPHFKVGMNTSFISLIHENSPYSKLGEFNTDYGLRLGWNAGAGLDWNVSDSYSLALDAIFSRRGFRKTTSGFFDGDNSEQTIRLAWLDVPLYIKYQDYTGQWRPYGYIGYAFHFKLAARADYTLNDNGEAGTKTTTLTNVSISDQQVFLNTSFVFGGGLKFKVGKNYILGDLRFQLGMSNVTDDDKILLLPPAPATTIVSDCYRVNSVTFSLGYVIPVYNPRKKGEWEPKGFLGKILNNNNKAETK